jgi:BirA family transcriptional regulator, biotin operon repressor / biotin---[acetyl-CoA-carboxylase] ligase
MTFGAPHRHFRVTDSTNARARELVEAGAPHGTVVTADEQTEGRGRQGRTWTAPPGKALLYSAILRPLDQRHLLLPLAVPLAVCEAAEELAPGIECAIKWPNDVWVDGRKLAGVLIEARMPGQGPTDATGERRTKRGKDAGSPNSSAIRATEDAAPRSVRRRQARAGGLDRASQQPQDGWAVIGVGLNLSISPDEFPPDLRDTAVSLFDPTEEGRGRSAGASRSGHRRVIPLPRSGIDIPPPQAVVGSSGPPPALPTTAKVLNRRLDHWVEAGRDQTLAAWRARDALRGREVSWDGGSGIADGIEDSGDLVVVAGGDRVVLGAGEVHLRL